MKNLKKLLAASLCAAVVLPCFSPKIVRAYDDDDRVTNDDYPVWHEMVPLTEEYFPDPIFREYMASEFDDDHDGFLHEYELRLIWNVHCENMAITTVKGIEYLPYLKGLWCKGNKITELDFSGNPEMKGIWCSYNNIKKLDFSPCPELEWVYCFECGLEEMDVTQNPDLGYLECNLNRGLTSVDLTHNPKLEHLFVSKCALTELDLHNNPLLCEVAAFDNQLTKLDVSNNKLLKRLDVWDNKKLGNMDVSNLKGLEYFNVAKTSMDKVDVTHNPELLELVASYNDYIKSIDLSKNPKLAYLNVECDTALQSLDLSHNPRLYHLFAFGLSSLDTIDISKNSRLCKAYNEGRYERDDENIGRVYFKNIPYGGSEDPFDDLNHIVGVDDDATVIATYNGTNDVPDSILDTNDGHSDNETFVTRGQAILTLYQLAGSPAVSGASRFTDVSSAYADAVKWGQDNNICFGYPQICANTFKEDEFITRQDWGLMAHRFADYMDFGTACDYGRSDWFDDFHDIDFYAWVPFTWAIQWRVVPVDAKTNKCYPHGRITVAEFEKGAAEIFDLEEGASYAQRVGGNFGADYVSPGTRENEKIEVHVPTVTPVPSATPTTAAKPGSSTSDNDNRPVITQPADPKASISEFVARIYTYVLEREPEAEGAAFWSEELWAFRRTGAEVAQGFIFSPEFENRKTDNKTFVTILYKTFFGRDPEEEGLNFWVNKLATGEMDRFTVANGFIYSQEWADTCASYGIRSGGDLKPTGKLAPTDLTYAFVERMYTTALGRGYDEEGKQYWASELANFNITGEFCGAAFLLSDEMTGYNLSDKDYLGRLYATFMNREPDADGEAYWLGVMASGTSRADVVFGFTRSPEFTDKCVEARILPY